MMNQKRELDKGMSQETTLNNTAAKPKEDCYEAAVTIGAQMGDKLASNAVTPHFMYLKRLFKECCKRTIYSDDVQEFALVLRVDGSIWHWNQEGCDRMRRSKKERYITIDIYVPRSRWEGVSGLEIRTYLATCVEDAFRRMIAKLQKDKVAVDGDGLLRDFAKVKERYLQPEATVSG